VAPDINAINRERLPIDARADKFPSRHFQSKPDWPTVGTRDAKRPPKAAQRV
jgi:hypothetical protein